MGCSSVSEINERFDPKEEIANKKKSEENLQIITKKEENEENNEKKENKEKKENNVKKEDKSFNKKKCESIVPSLPIRKKTNLQSLKDIMKSKTEKLSQKEKSFVLFLWICQNIEYDAQSYFAGKNVDCTPEGVFRNGKTVCSGYARLFKDIALYLGLNVLCVHCYAKGVGYEPGQKMTSTDHEYNVINLDNKWYHIDSTWGAGHIKEKDFVKELNEFYFLPDPELLIKTHFPEDEKWQLTKKKYTLEEFLKWPKIGNNFYKYEFNKFFPEEGFIELKDLNSQKFIIWGKNLEKKDLSCRVFLLEGEWYKYQPNLELINFYNDRFEINCIFNKKGRYLIIIYGNNNGETSLKEMMRYIINVENDAKNELKFPHSFACAKEIKIIKPLYNGLKSGTKVKFKFESKLDTIIIIDCNWHYLKRNKQGFFEEEIEIKSLAGKNVIIGKKKGTNIFSYLYAYDVI